MQKIFWCLVALFLLTVPVPAQISTNRSLDDLAIQGNREYEIGGVTITGSRNLDQQVILLISGLKVGEKIKLPGDETTRAIRNLWRQKLFDDVGIYVSEISGNLVFLEIRLKELPKLSRFGIRGLSKGKRDNLREELDLARGAIVTENLIVNTRNKAR